MHYNRKLITVMAIAVLAIIVAACQPTIPPTTPAPEARVLVVGDSITWQAGDHIRAAHPEWDVIAEIGYQLPNVTAEIEARRAAGTLGPVVVALGTNDAHAWNGGWDAQDEARWASAFLNLHPTTRLVFVLPALGYPNVEIDQARAFMQTLASSRPNTTVVDWASWIVLPNVLHEDDVHLADLGEYYAPTPEAVAARLAIIEEGLA